MKRFFTLAVYCLCLIGAYGQMHSEAKDKITAANGHYLFEKAELTIRNNDTKEIVEHRTITDTATIEIYNLHLEHIFLETEVSDNYIQEFTLPDRQKYKLDDMMILVPVEDDKKEMESHVEKDEKYVYEGKYLPLYSLQVDGEKLIVAIAKYSFGQSDYNFTMEAELIITMTKQKD